MKKLFAAILMAGMLVFASSAMATPVYFEDYTSLPFVQVWSTQSYSWTHNVPADLAVPPDTVISATLTVYAYWMSGSGQVTVEDVSEGYLVNGIWTWTPLDIGSIFTDGWTAADAPLDVTVTVSGYSSLTLWGSKFEICYENGEATAVPEPSTMLLLGFGLAGVAYARKRFKK